MQRASWRLAGTIAEFGCQPFSAKLDTTQPERGLQRLVSPETPALSEATWSQELLGIELPSAQAHQGHVPSESYVRAGDLVVTYVNDHPHRARIQIYWRACPTLPGNGVGIDLQVSVQTDLLDATPCMHGVSTLSPSEVWRLQSDDGVEFERVRFSGRQTVSFDSSQGPGCFLFRYEGSGLSYLEMIHPSDFTSSELSPGQQAGGYALRHRLFGGSLEKGVILRSRLRGVFLSAEGDFEVARQRYDEFVTASLPLTA